MSDGVDCFHMVDFEAWTKAVDFKLVDGGRDYERHNRLLNGLQDVIGWPYGGEIGWSDGIATSPTACRYELLNLLALFVKLTLLIFELSLLFFLAPTLGFDLVFYFTLLIQIIVILSLIGRWRCAVAERVKPLRACGGKK
jgi:hypothetical protein